MKEPPLIHMTFDDPMELLHDMRLPDDYVHILSIGLEPMGFRAISSSIEGDLAEQYHYTLVTNDQEQRYLIMVAPQILANPSHINRAALKEIIGIFANRFGRTGKLFIFYEEAPHAIYSMLCNKLAEEKEISIDFVPLSHLRDIVNLDQPLIQEFCERTLSLKVTAISPKPASETTLSFKDLKKEENQNIVGEIVQIISGQVSLEPNPEQYLQEKINKTQWPQTFKAKRIAYLTSDAERSVRELINYALNQGTIPHQEKLTALGDLLVTFLDDLGGEDHESLEKIIDTYHLIG